MMRVTGEILAIRLRRLGDVLATLGAVKALKEGAPGRRILFMVDPCYQELLQNEPYIDELISPPPKIVRPRDIVSFERYVSSLRDCRISCVLDFHSNPRSAVLAYLTGAPRRLGFDVKVRKVLYTEVEPRAILRNGKIVPRTSLQAALDLARRIGVAEGNTLPPKITVGRRELLRGRRLLRDMGIESCEIVGLNPGCSYPAKAWPEGHFVELARVLSGVGKKVVVLWGPGEREGAERIANRAGSETLLSPELSLAGSAAFLKSLSLLVTIDSGLKHLAVAVRTPTVTIFGPTSPGEWHMGTGEDRYLYLGLSCSPCRRLDCPFGAPCMERIKPETVAAAVDRALPGAEKVRGGPAQHLGNRNQLQRRVEPDQVPGEPLRHG